jgi:maltooligosyltrehalose trehalohydrolase
MSRIPTKMAVKKATMKCGHKMPFGAQLQEDGQVRFRLWAPAALQVDLCLSRGDGSLHLALKHEDEGWFSLTTSEAHAGDSYMYRINGDLRVPDPASRFQLKDVHGPSEIIDPFAFEWEDDGWRGRPWEETVFYELHVGTFSPEGTFAAVNERLDYLTDLGVTAIELMPVADFPGTRNWGYDGVLPFAPDSSYGRPEDLKRLIQAAHQRGLMVVLDVVYNHFGPEGNYLRAYAPQFFTDRHRTPWGDGLNFDGPESRPVRDFFIQNAIYWINEYRFDGLRLDAVQAIADDSEPDILTDLAAGVASAVCPGRYVHLIVENERNQARYLQRTPNCRPKSYTAQWNDDFHHALHVLVTGEDDGYYVDYATRPIDHLGRCLAEGFAYQGEQSYFRDGALRGESTREIPLTAFVSFLQNHDQIGNRAYGERLISLVPLHAVRAATEILLLAPSPPLLFMGEEFGAKTPFLFFCDFESNLAAAVTEGRRNEFARFAQFREPSERAKIPDPTARETFLSSKLEWNDLDNSRQQDWLQLYRKLIALRRQHIVPHLAQACSLKAEYSAESERALSVRWHFADNSELSLWANLGPAPFSAALAFAPQNLIYSSEVNPNSSQPFTLPPWSVFWFLQS